MMESAPPQIPAKKHQKLVPQLPNERQADVFRDDHLPTVDKHRLLVPTLLSNSGQPEELSGNPNEATKLLDDIVSSMMDSIKELGDITHGQGMDPAPDPTVSKSLQGVDGASDIMTTSLPTLPSESRAQSVKPIASPRPTPRPRKTARINTPPKIASSTPFDGHTNADSGTNVMSQSTPAVTHLASSLSASDEIDLSAKARSVDAKLPLVPNRSTDMMSSPAVVTTPGSLELKRKNSPVPTPRARVTRQRSNSDLAAFTTNSSKTSDETADLSVDQVSSHSVTIQDNPTADSNQTAEPKKPPRDLVYTKLAESINAETCDLEMEITPGSCTPPPEKHSSAVDNSCKHATDVPPTSIEDLSMPTMPAPKLTQHAVDYVEKPPREKSPSSGTITEISATARAVVELPPPTGLEEDIYEVMGSPTLQGPADDICTSSAAFAKTIDVSLNSSMPICEATLFPSDGIYDNTSNHRLPAEPATNQKSEFIGFPLPPSHPSTPAGLSALTPLSDTDLTLLDPTEYMSLWELNGSEVVADLTPTADESPSGGNFVASDLQRKFSQKKAGPPIPPRVAEFANTTPSDNTAFPFLQFPGTPTRTASHSASVDVATLCLRPAHPFVASLSSADEFRNSYLLPLPSDPFADVQSDDIVCFDNPTLSEAVQPDPEAIDSSIYSLAGTPEMKKLIPTRPAPSVPSKAGVHHDPPDLYTEIKKPAKVNTRAMTQEDNLYSLADEIDSGVDNLAVSYDSEDTLDEDSDPDNPSPDIPLKLPMLTSPRTAQTDRHGYLYKQGGKQNNKGWRKRYVTFDGHRLRYFSSEKSRVSKRIIPVQVMKSVENDVKDFDSGKFKFKVLTLNRVYLFAAETLEDHHFWTNILMQAIIMYIQKNGGGRGSIGKGMMLGGTMHTPDIKGFHRLDDNKRYLAIKDGKLCYYNTENDYQFATPVHEVSLDTASVKDIGKFRLQLTTPYHAYILSFDCDSDLEQWKISLEDGIAAALSDDNVLNEVYQNPSNRLCADCLGSKPYWAVLHLASIVCSHCAGIHRQFWPFKVKSLRMDTKVWVQPLVNLYVEVGNKTINSVWESNLTNAIDKITSNASSSQRRTYIIKKYCKKAFFMTSLNQLPPQPTTDQLNWVCALQLADSSNHAHIAQYLKLNGAEHESYDDIWAVMRKQLIDDLALNKEVIKSGHLYKMFSVKKEYPRQWVVLNPTTILCFDEETDSEPKLIIPCRNVINFNRNQNERNEPSFELTCSHGGNTYTYGADDWDTIFTWMTAIHKAITAETGRPNLGIDFDKAGYVHCKRGSLGVWKCCWVQSKKKCLYVLGFDQTLTEEIDLRKVHKLSLVPPDDTTTPGPGEEGGSTIVLYVSGHYVCLQSDLKQETEKWYKIIDQCCNEISHNLEDQQLSKDNVPVLIERCIEFISLHGMTLKGVYRESGTHSKVTQLLNDFISGARSVHIRLDDYTVHDVANVLKRYLRNLQEPIMSSQLYGKWLSAAMLTSANPHPSADLTEHNEKLYKYKELLGELPPVNFCTLKMVIGHLNRVAAKEEENKMTPANIATVFGPVLLSGSSCGNITQEKFTNTSYEILLVIDLMTYYQWLFSVDESELQIEDVIQDNIEKLKNFNPSPVVPSGEFILGIYVYNHLGEPINMKVPANKAASDVVSEVAASKRIPRVDGYSLFHIICSGELERALPEQEKVLDATLATSTWNPEHSKGVYLCVKEDIHKDFMENAAGPDISRFTELHFCDFRKSWKRMYFELAGSRLVCYKDKSNSRVSEEWRLADLSIYMGVERKRKPPTVFGITFLSATDDKTKYKDLPHLGRSICFGSEAEMYTWLSSIHYAQQNQEQVPQPNNIKLSVSSSALGDKKNVTPKNRLQTSIAKHFSFKK